MTTDHLSATFAALADPTRRAILARLATGECSLTELAEPFEMTLPAVSKHLRVLEHPDVLLDPGEGDLEGVGEIGDRGIGASEPLEDPAPGRVGERGEGSVESVG